MLYPKRARRSVPRCHFLERRRGPIDQGDPGIPAEATGIRRIMDDEVVGDEVCSVGTVMS